MFPSVFRLLQCGFFAALLFSLLAPAPARASFMGNGLTLPNGRWELGLGLGLARVPDEIGLGMNLELAYGLTSATEMRFRTGLRFGDDGRRTQADSYGRPYETETYITGSDSIANPEIGFRFLLTRGRGSVEVGLDARLMLPLGSDLGLLVGLPVSLRLGSRVRFDTGVLVPFEIHEDDTATLISVPFHLFIRLDSGTYLGPLTGVRFHEGGGESVPFGLAIGTQLASDAELRLWLLFPDISERGSARVFGTGAALYLAF